MPSVCFSISVHQFCDTNWMSNYLFQFLHCLPGVRVRPHKLKGSVPHDGPHFRCQLQVGSPDSPHYCSANHKCGDSHKIYALQILTVHKKWHDLGKCSTFIFIGKDTTQTARWKGYIGQGMSGEQGRGWRASMSSLGVSPFQHIDVFPNREAPWTPSCRTFC